MYQEMLISNLKPCSLFVGYRATVDEGTSSGDIAMGIPSSYTTCFYFTCLFSFVNLCDKV